MSKPQLPVHSSQATIKPNPFGVSETELRNRPEKYLGYRVFSRWTGSTEAFFIVRQFSTLNARIILSLQDEIGLLEQQLDTLENKFARPGTGDYDNSSLRKDFQTDRKELLDKIRLALEKYNRFVNEYYTLQSHPAAPINDVKSVKSWFEAYPGAISEEETLFISRDDLISVRPQPKSPLRNLIESIVFKIGYFPNIFRRLPQDPLLHHDLTLWYEDDKIELVASLVIGVLGLIVFAAPFWGLEFMQSQKQKLGLITGVVILFYCIVSVATTARPFESLGAAAAYAAVLMVFLTVSTANSSSTSGTFTFVNSTAGNFTLS
ncbi:hypothetical protein EG329_002817 [Mollisiaceae sp. DMI_Dod_QoI]|nr:hypothetical protein EG329_002817 [Helotiales sp. DMI_Dod_QoI]